MENMVAGKHTKVKRVVDFLREGERERRTRRVRSRRKCLSAARRSPRVSQHDSRPTLVVAGRCSTFACASRAGYYNPFELPGPKKKGERKDGGAPPLHHDQREEVHALCLIKQVIRQGLGIITKLQSQRGKRHAIALQVPKRPVHNFFRTFGNLLIGEKSWN